MLQTTTNHSLDFLKVIRQLALDRDRLHLGVIVMSAHKQRVTKPDDGGQSAHDRARRLVMSADGGDDGRGDVHSDEEQHDRDEDERRSRVLLDWALGQIRRTDDALPRVQ